MELGVSPGVDLAMCSFGVPRGWLEAPDVREVGGRATVYSRKVTVPGGGSDPCSREICGGWTAGPEPLGAACHI